jgi:hypothetical protein
MVLVSSRTNYPIYVLHVICVHGLKHTTAAVVIFSIA